MMRNCLNKNPPGRCAVRAGFGSADFFDGLMKMLAVICMKSFSVKSLRIHSLWSIINYHIYIANERYTMKKTLLLPLLLFLLTACSNIDAQAKSEVHSPPAAQTERDTLSKHKDNESDRSAAESPKTLETEIDYALAFEPTADQVFLHSDAVIAAKILERDPPLYVEASWFTPYTVEVTDVLRGTIPEKKITVYMTGVYVTPEMMAAQMDANELKKMKIDLSSMTQAERTEIYRTESDRSIDLLDGETIVFGLNKGIKYPGWFLATPGYAAYRMDENRQLEDRYEQETIALEEVLAEVRSNQP